MIGPTHVTWTHPEFKEVWDKLVERYGTGTKVMHLMGMCAGSMCNWKQGGKISRPILYALRYIEEHPTEFGK